MGQENKDVNQGGRPTLYRSAFNEQARKLCLLGATDKELADFFEVNVDTITEWKRVHPKFAEALKKGKAQADATVADKLFKRATGYSHPEVDIKVIGEKIVKTRLVKHYAPDTTAAIFWLKNRGKENWRDKQHLDIDFENMSDEAAAKVAKIIIEQNKKNRK